MFVIIGIVVVIASVLVGFMMHGGPLGVLLQWNEFIIIGGASIGALMVSCPTKALGQIGSKLGAVLKGDPYTKKEYTGILKIMFELFNVAMRDGLISIEPHIEKPEQSAIFKKNQFLLHHKTALSYLTDTMKLLLGGGVSPHDLETLLDGDIETQHQGGVEAASLVQKIGDSLPGLGIVAAVLGIVITMQAINGPPEEIGLKVAAALVGTFLGILLSYGFVQPLATHMEVLSQAEMQFFQCIKNGVVAYAKGNSPTVVVEFARRSIPLEARPTFTEVEQAVKGLKAS
jgi:chemotaxis protein MotA